MRQTAFYYLNEPLDGGETAFPAADGAMTPADAMALKEPAAEGAGLVVKPELGGALLWYNHDAEGQIDAAAVHAGCRVLAGEKWGANHWVRLGPPPEAKPDQNGRSCDASPEDHDEAGTTNAEPSKNAAKNKKKRQKAAARRRAESAAGDGTCADAERAELAELS